MIQINRIKGFYQFLLQSSSSSLSDQITNIAGVSMETYKWWQTAVFYQIYPRSLTSKLSYLNNLGVDALWLSPFFPSPNWDCGYDISDYTNIAPEYGNLDDFNIFLNMAHKYGMHIILDLVLNHSSNEHPWFVESKSSRNNPKSDWYIWHDPIINPGFSDNINPPNNWQSCFDGPAWEHAPTRSQYYYHYFMKQQPDLNWSNPQVKQAMWNVVRFWLDLGVDGFRLDAIGTIFEDTQLTPHTVPLNLAGLRFFNDTAQTHEEKKLLAQYWQDMFTHQWGGSGIHDLMKELRLILEEYPGDRMLVGEDDNIEYLGDGNDELHLVFNFPLMRTDTMTASHVHNNQTDRQMKWGCNTLGNHDSPRVFNRYGDGTHNYEMARLNSALILTLPGTPFLYYGEEIGMSDLIIEDSSLLRDTMATWYYSHLVNDLHLSKAEAARSAWGMSRDKNRTPMQWMNTDNAGFSPPSVQPWLPVNPNYQMGINVADQENQSSLLNFYRQILLVRKLTPALQHGDYFPLDQKEPNTIFFLRYTPLQKVIVVLNYSNQEIEIKDSNINKASSRIIFTHPHEPDNLSELRVRPFGIVIAEIIDYDGT
jgi:alpha-glucosidase